MRDSNVADMTFVDITGSSVLLKEMREYASDLTLKEAYSPQKGETLDFIAAKEYGDGHESDAYKIHDFNVQQIVDNGFSLIGVRKLRIPN